MEAIAGAATIVNDKLQKQKTELQGVVTQFTKTKATLGKKSIGVDIEMDVKDH